MTSLGAVQPRNIVSMFGGKKGVFSSPKRQDWLCAAAMNLGAHCPRGKAVGAWSWSLYLHLAPRLRMSGVRMLSWREERKFYLYMKSGYPVAWNPALRYCRPHWTGCGGKHCSVHMYGKCTRLVTSDHRHGPIRLVAIVQETLLALSPTVRCDCLREATIFPSMWCLRSSIFWDVSQRQRLVCFWRFGTAPSHLQGAVCSKRKKFLRRYLDPRRWHRYVVPKRR